MRALRWLRLLVGVLALMLVLEPAAAIGRWLGRLAQRLDVRVDEWRHELRRSDARVADAADEVALAVRHGATSGAVEYEHLDDRDMERLARAIDNRGCYVKVWHRRAEWTRRDRAPTGAHLSLAALPPADRDAFSDAIANLDGEG